MVTSDRTIDRFHAALPERGKMPGTEREGLEVESVRREAAPE
jgi:hypothetical protein